MIPILFSAGTTAFDTNGIGRLTDATSCNVVEERNGSYELTLQYPISGKYGKDLRISNIIFATPSDGKNAQAFRIYEITKPIKGIVTVRAEHISYQLSHIPVMPFEANSLERALAGIKQNAAEDCPFEFWTDKVVDSPYTQAVPSSIRARLGGEEGSILDLYKGEFEWDNYTVKLWQHRGIDRGVTLRYGKNITDLEQEESIEKTITGIVPYWFGTTDTETNENTLVYLPEIVVDSPYAENYPFPRTIPVDFTSDFQTPPTEEILRTRANTYITENNIGVPKVSLKVSFVPLWQTEEYKNIAQLERVYLCDDVTIIFEKLGIQATSKVIKTDYNVLLERYNAIELGEATSTLSKTIASTDSVVNKRIEDAASNFAREISRATNILAGGLGGHVIFGRDADGKINEIRIMDTDDRDTAVNVIRMNMKGFGFSTNGYSGPFNSAWTIDGTFDASKVNVVNLIADYISGGVLKDLATDGQRFYLNLNTGELRMRSTGIVMDDGTTTLSDELADIREAAEAGNLDIVIDSSAGNIFKNRGINTILTARAYFRGQEVTSQIPSWTWSKHFADGTTDTSWSAGSGNMITITAADVQSRAVFYAEATYTTA